MWRSEAGDEEVLLDSLEDHARRNVHKEVAVQLNNSGNRAVQRVKLVRANVIQLTTSYTDFFVVAQMSVDIVGFVKLVGVRCGRDELDRGYGRITAICLLPLVGHWLFPL